MGRLLSLAGLSLLASAAILLCAGLQPNISVAHAMVAGIAVLFCVVLRVFGLAVSLRHTLLACIGTAVTLEAGRVAWFIYQCQSQSQNAPWLTSQLQAQLNGQILRVATVELPRALVLSTLVGLAVWRPSATRTQGTAARVRPWSVALMYSGAAFVIGSIAVDWARAAYLGDWSIPDVSELAGRAAVAMFTFFFSAVWYALVVYLPVILLVRRFLHPAWMVVVGVVLFPFPMLTPLVLATGRLSVVWEVLQNPPVALFVAVPYVVGGAVLGWKLGGRAGSLRMPPAVPDVA